VGHAEYRINDADFVGRSTILYGGIGGSNLGKFGKEVENAAMR